MVFDSYLCWPRTKAGEKVWQKCPEGVRGLDNESKFEILKMKLEMLHTYFKSEMKVSFPFLLLILVN